MRRGFGVGGALRWAGPRGGGTFQGGAGPGGVETFCGRGFVEGGAWKGAGRKGGGVLCCGGWNGEGLCGRWNWEGAGLCRGRGMERGRI